MSYAFITDREHHEKINFIPWKEKSAFCIKRHALHHFKHTLIKSTCFESCLRLFDISEKVKLKNCCTMLYYCANVTLQQQRQYKILTLIIPYICQRGEEKQEYRQLLRLLSSLKSCYLLYLKVKRFVRYPASAVKKNQKLAFCVFTTCKQLYIGTDCSEG